MTLRAKLLLAQLPLVAVVIVIGALALQTIGVLGESSQAILKDNYRSLLAVERMQAALDAPERFEAELAVQEHNITEPGEADATRRLRASWTAHDSVAVRVALQRVLDLNQDAMVRKSEAAHQLAGRRETLMLLALLVAFALGLYGSLSVTTRLLRPLNVLSQATRRLSAGDFQARAIVHGADEIAGVAHELNLMADSLAHYRSSSLGELLQAQHLTQAAIDSLPDPVLLLKRDGELLGSNARAEVVLELAHRAQGTIYDSLPAALRVTIEKAVAHVIANDAAYAPDEDAATVESSEGIRHFLPRANPVHDENGAITGVAVILQDVTRERRFDALRSDLVATVAHEFRTPLTSLRMSLYILSEQTVGELSEKQKDLLDAGRQDTERLHGLVEELLELSRLEHGQTEMQRKPLTPVQLVVDTFARTQRLGDDARVTMRNEVSPFLPAIFVDPDRMPLVLDNLVSNAIRHSPNESEVVIRANADANVIRFEVSDTGPGIAPEHHERIFEKFYRVPGGSGGSAGLGLYIAREVVRNHGGMIGVTSTPAGSTFWFTLPLAETPR